MTETSIKRSQEEWDIFFYRIAQSVAQLSKDPDRKVGAVIVSPDKRQMSFGYNGFPPEIEDLPSLLADRNFKLVNMVHAENNALKQAPFQTTGCTVYVTRFPCLGCTIKLIKEAGISKVVAPIPDFDHHRWGKQWRQAMLMMNAEGITVVQINIDDDLNNLPAELFRAQIAQGVVLTYGIRDVHGALIVGGGGSGGSAP